MYYLIVFGELVCEANYLSGKFYELTTITHWLDEKSIAENYPDSNSGSYRTALHSDLILY